MGKKKQCPNYDDASKTIGFSKSELLILQSQFLWFQGVTPRKIHGLEPTAITHEKKGT